LTLTLFFVGSLCPEGFPQMIFGVRLSGPPQQNLPSDFAADYGTVSFGSFLGKDISGKETVYLGVDYSSFSVKSDPGGEIYSRQFVPWVGLRYYLSPRFEEKVAAALCLEVFKTYTKLRHNQGGVYSDGDLEYLEDLYAPWGFTPCLSVEYLYSSFFSLSGQAGLRFSYSKGSISGSSNFADGETKLKTVSGFGSMILNFRWQRR
jgi:hypothetical protein